MSPRNESGRLAAANWRDFCRHHTTLEDLENTGRTAQFFANTKVQGANHRDALRKWCQGQREPTIWLADRFLTTHHMHIQDFFDWCTRNDRNPWRNGIEPYWHRDEPEPEIEPKPKFKKQPVTLPLLKRAAQLYRAGLSWAAVRRVLEVDAGAPVPAAATLQTRAAEFGLVEKGQFRGGGGRATGRVGLGGHGA